MPRDDRTARDLKRWGFNTPECHPQIIAARHATPQAEDLIISLWLATRPQALPRTAQRPTSFPLVSGKCPTVCGSRRLLETIYGNGSVLCTYCSTTVPSIEAARARSHHCQTATAVIKGIRLDGKRPTWNPSALSIGTSLCKLLCATHLMSAKERGRRPRVPFSFKGRMPWALHEGGFLCHCIS